jgi:ubiquinone/menaquinone biosynthesis C-methylase UbiE
MANRAAQSEPRRTWESAAPGWVTWESRFSAGLSAATDLLIEMADVVPGARVLDVACGGGDQTFRVAGRIGPDGIVVANDISSTMLDHVRQAADQRGIENVRTEQCAAEDLDRTQIPFDAAICRLGLMLFPTPTKAVSAIRSVLKPGAHLAALVFSKPANNPFASQPMSILLRHAGKQPPAPGQPGIFALGGDGVLGALLKDGGLTDVKTRTVRTTLTLPNADDALEMMHQAFGAFRAVVADLSDDERSRAYVEVRECLEQFETNGRFEVAQEFVIGSGAR